MAELFLYTVLLSQGVTFGAMPRIVTLYLNDCPRTLSSLILSPQK